MDLFLIRHLESEKNVVPMFSSAENNERLTDRGLDNAKQLAYHLNQIIQKNGYVIKNIYVANSERCIQSCSSFAKQINVNILYYDNLLPADKAGLSGITEREANDLFPSYMKTYEMYRHGLYNFYNIDTIGKECKPEYERRVLSCLNDILSVKGENAKFVFLHRSSMTPILLYFARSYYGYPVDFYGYAPVDLNCIYALRSSGSRWDYIALNCPYWELQEKI